MLLLFAKVNSAIIKDKFKAGILNLWPDNRKVPLSFEESGFVTSLNHFFCFLGPDGSEIDEEAAEDDLMAEENRLATKTSFQVKIIIVFLLCISYDFNKKTVLLYVYCWVDFIAFC